MSSEHMSDHLLNGVGKKTGSGFVFFPRDTLRNLRWCMNYSTWWHRHVHEFLVVVVEFKLTSKTKMGGGGGGGLTSLTAGNKIPYRTAPQLPFLVSLTKGGVCIPPNTPICKNGGVLNTPTSRVCVCMVKRYMAPVSQVYPH